MNFTTHNSLVDVLIANMENDKGITFISGENTERFVLYSELYARAERYLHKLQCKGIGKDSELILQIEDNECFLYSFWACLLGGIIAVPVTVSSNDEHRLKLFNIWSILDRPSIITDEKTAKALEKYANNNDLSNSFEVMSKRTVFIDELNEVTEKGKPSLHRLDDIAFIQFSSGSTGDPKGVVLTHGNLLTNINAAIECGEYTYNDSSLSWMPLTHDLGLIGCHLVPLSVNIHLYLMPTSLFIKHPNLWLEKANYHQVTLLYSPNFGYRYFLDNFKRENAANWDLSQIRLIFNGAEPISTELCIEFLNTMKEFGLKRNTMYCVYGMAEASVAVSFPPAGEDFVSIKLDRESISIGQTVKEVGYSEDVKSVCLVDVGYPVKECSIRICDENSNEIADDIVGYIQIKGKNVTSGYYNNKEATEKAITKDGWLNTSDLGFTRNGRLIITGRFKDIIFVNGQNYYPHDIERVVEELEDIESGKIAACGVFNKEAQKEQIILFVLFRRNLKEFIPLSEKIRKYINKQMNLEIRDVVPVKRIPKTTSGKVQRYKLGESYSNGQYQVILDEINMLLSKNISELQIEGPSNQIEEKLLSIWQDILEIEKDKIGTNDNFFELGGNSLRATVLASKVQEEFEIEIPLNEMFDIILTIKEIAKYIQDAEKTAFYSILPSEEKEYYLASSAQKRMFILNQLDGIGTAYNVPIAVKAIGNLDMARFEKVFKEIVQRHESLRTSFEVIDGSPVQKIHKKVNLEITCQEAEESQISNIINYLIKPFDLKKPPLLRVNVISVGGSYHIIVFDMHHIISDGVSIKNLISELSKLYDGQILPELKVQYKDFSEWQNELLKSDAFKAQEEYWTSIFSGDIPVLTLPLDFKRPSLQTFKGDTLKFQVSFEQIIELDKLSKQYNVTLNMLMYSIYTLLICKYSNQNDIVIGSLVAGRRHTDLQNVIGVFMNFLPVRNKINVQNTFLEYLNSVTNNLLNAYENQDYPFEIIIDHTGHRFDPSRNALFDTLINFHNEIGESINMEIEDLKTSIIEINRYISTLDLKLDIIEGNSGELLCSLEYNTCLFRKETVTGFIKHFQCLIELIIKNPNQSLEEINLFTEIEETQIEVKRKKNSTKAAHPLKLVTSATFTAEPIERYLKYWCGQFDLDIIIEFTPYNQVYHELLESFSAISINDGINLLLIRFEDFLRDDLSTEDEKCNKLERSFIELTGIIKDKPKKVPYFIGIFPVLSQLTLSEKVIDCLYDINKRWEKALQEIEGVYIIDFNETAGIYNVLNIYDPIKDRIGHQPFSDEYYAAIGTSIARKICAWRKQPFKVIALDCDNTLWKGACGEDGSHGIVLDQPYLELQSFMLDRYKDGILLVLCSKNNESDVFEVFTNHPGMILRKDHFAAWKINWNSKSENLRNLAEDLNLCLDSFIYIDDSTAECFEVMANCPEVLTLNLPKSSDKIYEFLKHVWAFDRFKITAEDKIRTEMYASERKRLEFHRKVITLEEYLKNLDLKVSMNLMDITNLSRIAQLTQRTNQFNMSTIRRNEQELLEIYSMPNYKCWVIEAADRFGEYGLIGTIITFEKEDRLIIDTFLLSCRILGRNVEIALMRGLGEYCREKKLNMLQAEFYPTSKNKPFLEFLKRTDWKMCEEHEGSFTYTLSLEKVPNSIQYIEFYFNSIYPKRKNSNSNTGTLFEDFPLKLINRQNNKQAVETKWEIPIVNEKNLLHLCYLLPLKMHDGNMLLEEIVNNVSEKMSQSDEYVAPSNDVEKKLADIWQKVLGVNKPSVTDNFFDLGGDSLKVVQMVSMIYKQFGIEIPFNALYLPHTIKDTGEKINLLLGGEQKVISNQPVTLLNDKNDNNIFAFPPMLGFGFAYKEMAKILTEYSFYSFDYIENSGRLQKYVEIITNIQEKGPYILLGFSSGGKLAFEVAKELSIQGHIVSGVVIIDTLMDKVFNSHPILIQQTNILLSIKHSLLYFMNGCRISLKSINSKSLSYIKYSSNKQICKGKINADIYLLKSPYTSNRCVDRWGSLTEKSFIKYIGYGRHGEMIDRGFAEKNVEVIKEMLNNMLK